MLLKACISTVVVSAVWAGRELLGQSRDPALTNWASHFCGYRDWFRDGSLKASQKCGFELSSFRGCRELCMVDLLSAGYIRRQQVMGCSETSAS
jgi:hypothetical protein